MSSSSIAHAVATIASGGAVPTLTVSNGKPLHTEDVASALVHSLLFGVPGASYHSSFGDVPSLGAAAFLQYVHDTANGKSAGVPKSDGTASTAVSGSCLTDCGVSEEPFCEEALISSIKSTIHW